MLALCLAFIGVAAIALLIPIERRLASPIFPCASWPARSRAFLTAATMVGAVMFVLIFYSPLLLQQVLGYTPSEAGLLLTPLVAAISVGSIINGRLYPKQSEPQRLMVFGSCLLATGTLAVLLISSATCTVDTGGVFHQRLRAGIPAAQSDPLHAIVERAARHRGCVGPGANDSRDRQCVGHRDCRHPHIPGRDTKRSARRACSMYCPFPVVRCVDASRKDEKFDGWHTTNRFRELICAVAICWTY